LGLPGICVVGGNLQEATLRDKIATFVSAYIDKFQEKLRVRNLPIGMFSFGRPTNYYLAIDRKRLHLIYSSQFAGGIPEVLYIDLRGQKSETFSLEEIGNFIRAQRGITDWHGVSFTASIIDASPIDKEKLIDQMTEEQLKKEFEEIVRRHQPLFIPIEQVSRFLEIGNEDSITNILLVPLLRHLGFETAESKGHHERVLEFGQDIQRMKIRLPTDHWLYFSAQVKVGDIKADTDSQKDFVEKILHQTYAQLNWEMPDPEVGMNVKPDHILLIVCGNITEAAKQYIYRHELTKSRRVLLWEKEMILRLCQEKGLPDAVQKAILDYNKRYQPPIP